jgi:hypothetical protein
MAESAVPPQWASNPRPGTISGVGFFYVKTVNDGSFFHELRL